jgi:hypothetical protein
MVDASEVGTDLIGFEFRVKHETRNMKPETAEDAKSK